MSLIFEAIVCSVSFPELWNEKPLTTIAPEVGTIEVGEAKVLLVATVATVAYLGLEARAVEVQAQLSTGLSAFHIVGLPDKAVAESRQRVRAALREADGDKHDAARILGISYRTLQRRVKQFDLEGYPKYR